MKMDMLEVNAIGNVLELFISIGAERENLSQIKLDKNGVIGDKFYGKNPNRSVLITSLDSYKLAKLSNIEVNYSQLGENLLIDYNPYHLKIGEQLHIGDVVLEISQNCTICKSLTKVDKRLPKVLESDRGIFAKVICSGTINKGNKIYLIKKD